MAIAAYEQYGEELCRWVLDNGVTKRGELLRPPRDSPSSV